MVAVLLLEYCFMRVLLLVCYIIRIGLFAGLLCVYYCIMVGIRIALLLQFMCVLADVCLLYYCAIIALLLLY